jgi:hypothetical protein
MALAVSSAWIGGDVSLVVATTQDEGLWSAMKVIVNASSQLPQA